MDRIFDGCVWLLVTASRACGLTYKQINVWIFCILWPLFTLASLYVIARQRRELRRLRARAADRRA